MSQFTLGQKGVALVDKKQYKEAIEPLSQAIKVTKSPAWLLARAHAYQQTKELERALDDADMAYISAAARTQVQSKSQMIAAQYRRAVVLFKMQRFADADACCVWSMQLIEGKKFHTGEDDVARNVDENGDYKATVEDAKDTSTMPQQDPSQAAADSKNRFAADWTRAFVWRSQALAAMAKLPKGDPGRKITVPRVPQLPKERPDIVGDGNGQAEASASSLTAKDKTKATGAAAATAATTTSSEQTHGAATPKAAPPADKEKLKVDYYQTNAAVSLTIYVKDTDKEKLDIQISNGDVLLIKGLPNRHVPVTLQLSNHASGLGPNISVTKHKIELSLIKAQPGQKWGGWGSQVLADSASAPQPAPETKKENAPKPSQPAEGKKKKLAPAPPPATAPKEPAGPPSYPTSSKSGPKDWEHIGEGEDENAADVNQFFKQLYANSTPEQQRAMMKSFVESNGTTLSTDWNDVKGRKVETAPPDGVEEKKW